MTSICSASDSKRSSLRAARQHTTPANPCSRRCAATSTPCSPARTPLRDSLRSTTSLDVLAPRMLRLWPKTVCKKLWWPLGVAGDKTDLSALRAEKNLEQKDPSTSPPLQRPTAVRTAWLSWSRAISRIMSPSSVESEPDRGSKGDSAAVLRRRTPIAAEAGLRSSPFTDASGESPSSISLSARAHRHGEAGNSRQTVVFSASWAKVTDPEAAATAIFTESSPTPSDIAEHVRDLKPGNITRLHSSGVRGMQFRGFVFTMSTRNMPSLRRALTRKCDRFRRYLRALETISSTEILRTVSSTSTWDSSGQTKVSECDKKLPSMAR
eukprot:scaffold519_cov30-Tisochrysis_lutea.AAC.2